MNRVLSLDAVTVRIDGFTILDELDFDLAVGELRFLIGPNGAGKTTMLDVITGKTRATSGKVRFNDVVVNHLQEHQIAQLGIARKFQTPSIFPSLSVRENVELAALGQRSVWSLLGRRRPDSVAADRADWALERVGLASRSQVRSGSLAHGEKQWLEIAMLLAAGPSLLLLDEPVAGMTRRERERTGEILRSLASNHTILVVEHDMEFVRQFAHKVTVLHQGRVLCEGDMALVQDDPRVREVYLGRGHGRVA